MEKFSQWFHRRFIGTELGNLVLIVAAIIVLIWLFGHLLMPVFASVIIAYLLDGMVRRMERWKVPHFLAVNIVFAIFLGSLIVGLFVLLPLVWDQLSNLLNEIPGKIKQLQHYIFELSERYPNYISSTQISKWTATFQNDIGKVGRVVLAYSISTISNVMLMVVYLVLVPLMVYFFLKDRATILNWLTKFLPNKRHLSKEVWLEINEKFGQYIRAKILEMIIVGILSTIAFLILGLNYSILLGVLVGLSVLIPYVGVVLVTVPVLIVGYLEWGMSMHFLYLIIVYTALMLFDGNILVTILFSETMNLHPVSVIIAILLFGGLWGFWGIFFAIPLASVIQVLIDAWYRHLRGGHHQKGNLPL